MPPFARSIRLLAPGRAVLALASLVGFVATAPTASALSFQADFTRTPYQVQPGDTYADLLAAHQAGTFLTSVGLPALTGVSAQVEAGVTTDYSILMTADLGIAVAGQYTFQVGADWGRGGGVALIDASSGTVLDELVRTDDIWWNNDWGNADVFTTVVDLTAGSDYQLAWLGFEGCCGGVTSVRFAYEGGAFQDLDTPNATPYVSTPEPGTGVLLAVGLGMLGAWARGSRR